MAGNDWMTNIADATNITHLAIPGTHDSGAYEAGNWVSRPMTYAQTLDIPAQLNLGVRALDLRCGSNYYGSSFSLYHGPFQLPDYLPAVIADINTFLTQNPTEFVILLLKLEPPGSSDWSEALNEIVNHGLDGRIFRRLNRETRWPTVGEMRGQALILSRFPNPHRFHFDTRGWGNNVVAQDIDVTSSIQGYPERLHVHIQDLYDRPNLTDKVRAITGALDDARRTVAWRRTQTLHVNFTSYVVRFSQPRDIGRDVMKPRLQQAVAPFHRFYGVNCVDAVDAEQAAMIYGDNF
jgi:hypothetical protein